MAGFIRVVATDFDGTLSTHGRRPEPEVLAALAQVRSAGVTVLLVTGRILSELVEDFPDVDEHVDAIVAENGAVLRHRGEDRPLTAPLDPVLPEALRTAGIPFRQGRVLLATWSEHAVAVLREIRVLGLDAQLVYNRAALMVLPAGVTKGTGVYEALGELGISHHSALGIGDAENDHPLLDVCEIGVAVGNAVPALKRHADVVLDRPAGDGVRDLLDGPLLQGTGRVHSGRWRLVLGTGPDGTPVELPSSQVNLLVCGESGAGKSAVAGLLAERLTALHYSVLLVDPEGDHGGLARLRGVVAVDARDGLPAPDRIVQRCAHRFSSVVLDLSSLSPAETRDYLPHLIAAVHDARRETGLPHWLFLDEAQSLADHSAQLADRALSGDRGCCLVTWQPGSLAPEVLAATDAVVVVPLAGWASAETLHAAAAVSGAPADEIGRRLSRLSPQQVLLAAAPEYGGVVPVTVPQPVSGYVRHRHKYATQQVRTDRRFHFRDGRDRPAGTAGSMRQLCDVLRDCEASVIRHHAEGGDLARWIRGVFRDRVLADQVAEVERAVAAGHLPPDTARDRLVTAVAARYPA